MIRGNLEGKEIDFTTSSGIESRVEYIEEEKNTQNE